jgi:tetratricopeptide (TPR) repeat protein
LKKIFISILCSSLFACATTSKYNKNEFTTANYQANIDNMITATDSLNDFSDNDRDSDKINIKDLSTLVQANVYFNQGDYANALPIYTYLANQYAIPKVIYKAILCYEHLGIDRANAENFDNLVKMFISEAPQTSIARILQIKVSLTDGNITLAKNDLDMLLANADSNRSRTILLFLSATISNNLSDINNNILNGFAKYVIDEYSEYPESYLFAAMCYATTDNVNELQEALNTTSKQYQEWQIPLYWSVGILSNNGNYATIIYIVKQMLDKNVMLDKNLQNIYIAALINNKQTNIAQNYLLDQLKNQHSNNTLLNLGIIAARQKNYDEAVKYFSQVDVNNIAINNILYLLIALIYDYKQQPNLAVSYYTKISGNIYLENIANTLLANGYFTLHDSIKLNNVLNKLAQDKNLQGVDVILFKAQYYISVSDYNSAYLLLKDNYRFNKDNKKFIYSYAASAAGLSHKTNEVIKLYNIYIKMDPKSAYGYNDLAYIYADQTKNYKQALKYAKKAASIDITDENILDTLGFVYYKMGDYNNAYAYINNSYQISHSVDSEKHLKNVLISLKKPDLANKVIILDKDNFNSEMKILLVDKMLNLLMLLQYGVKISN